MKKVIKIILIILGILITCIFLLVIGLGYLASKNPSVPTDFENTVQTGGEIEKIYLQKGDFEVSYFEEKSENEDLGMYEIYYPKEMTDAIKKYPVIVVVNGTGVKASKYPALLEHFASWGFIVIGNEQEFTWKGDGVESSVAYLLQENEKESSIFYNKLDTENIGIVGHSQGGVGVFNGITIQQHSDMYKCAVALSPTSETVAANLGWSYDISKVDIPMFMMTGTGEFEVKSVIPYEELCTMYEKLSNSKVVARRTNAQHEHMLYQATGYVTAWFMWHLQGDENAAKAFLGDSCELINNALYQDIEISLQ